MLFSETDWVGVVSAIGSVTAALVALVGAVFAGLAKLEATRANVNAVNANATAGAVDKKVVVLASELETVKVQSDGMKSELVAAIKEAAGLQGEKIGRAEQKMENHVNLAAAAGAASVGEVIDEALHRAVDSVPKKTRDMVEPPIEKAVEELKPENKPKGK